jgi:hypothetical protein
MELPDKIKAFDGFGAGWAIFKGTRAPDFFPPLNDEPAQREWLGGFGAAWAESPNEAARASILHDDGMGGESLEEALCRALEGRADLLFQLQDHGLDTMSRTAH